MKIQMIRNTDDQDGCRYFSIVTKFAPAAVKFALPFEEIRD